jgi:acyl carrier protein
MDRLVVIDDTKMLATLKELIVEHVVGLDSLDQVSDNSDLVDLGLDSMAGLNLLLDMEEEFEVQFPEEYLTAEVFSTPMTLAAAIKAIPADP